MEFGLIEWYDESKGFGVLKTPEGKEVFLHITNWKDAEKIQITNQKPIVFEPGIQRGRSTALNCSYFDFRSELHWRELFSLSEKTSFILLKNGRINLFYIVFSELNIRHDFTYAVSLYRDICISISNESLLDQNELIHFIYKRTENKQVKKEFFEIISRKIEQLNDEQKFKIWKGKLITEFTPEAKILAHFHQEISLFELKNFLSQEAISLIVSKKIESLNADFILTEFLNFNIYLSLITSLITRDKFISELNAIATKHYLKIINKEITKTTKEAENLSGIKKILKDYPTFLSEENLGKIKETLSEAILKNCNFRILIECWREEILNEIDEYLLANFRNQSNDDLVFLLKCSKISDEITGKILDKFFEDGEFCLLLEQVKGIDDILFEKYDKLVFDSISQKDYFQLWITGKGHNIPTDYVKDYLNHDENRYAELKRWIKDRLISRDQAIEALVHNCNLLSQIDDRYKFYRVYFSLKTIIELAPDFSKITKNLIPNDFISLILWHFRKEENLDFEALKGKFIYFKPEDQVHIFKRLFYLKHTGVIDFDLEKLDEIIRADIDLYLLNENFNDDFLLDISTHIIIEAIKSFVKIGNFKFESDLILKDLKRNGRRRFKIRHYFDKCEGRLTGDWNWDTNGKITKVHFNGDKYYYAISFSPTIEVEAYDRRRGTYSYHEKNPDFNWLVEEVKKLPGRKWNPVANHWGVPSVYSEAVYTFAAENRFFIDLGDKKHYDNNVHLLVFTRNNRSGKKILDSKNIPDGITFCEGRKANKEHSKLKREFWWCGNLECFGNSVKDHFTTRDEAEINSEPWVTYTLLDFLKILRINTDDSNLFDSIIDGHYYKFLGHINAFNRLLDRLYCRECNDLLYPERIGHFSLYTDVWFQCINETCSQNHQKIYLNHCMNGECRSIIDSRVSKACSHGMLICSNCGGCCSEDFFRRRLNNLREVGGYIHAELIENVEQRNGHLEKREYYCYKCSGMMSEPEKDKFKCLKCNVTYDLSRFRWVSKKWTEVHRRRLDYPGSSVRGNDESSRDIMPF